MNGIIGNIRLHDRNAIPNEDQTHLDIRNLLSAHEGTPHGAGITLEQARDAIAAILTDPATTSPSSYDDAGAGAGNHHHQRMGWPGGLSKRRRSPGPDRGSQSPPAPTLPSPWTTPPTPSPLRR